MGEPIGLSMRGGLPKTAAPKSDHSGRTDHTPIRLASLLNFDQYLSSGNPTSQLRGIVAPPDSGSSFGPIDGLDKATWALEGVGTIGGVGLLLGRHDTASQWAGTFMITTSASNVLLEWVDRRLHLAHHHRLPRAAMSLLTGMLVSNLVVLGFGDFKAGAVGGDSSRNPTNGYGP